MAKRAIDILNELLEDGDDKRQRLDEQTQSKQKPETAQVPVEDKPAEKEPRKHGK